jgi:aminopeptidase N
MRVTSVTCSSLGVLNTDIPFRHVTDKLFIPAQTDPAKQWFYARYRGVPADGLIIGKNKFGDRTFFSDNWPDRAPHWLACVNHPGDKASFYWNVEAPQHYTVTANGELTMETNNPGNRKSWVFIQEAPIPVKVAAIGVAILDRTLMATENCIPVYKYYYPQTATNKYYKFDSAAVILKFFSRLIGEYPFKKLANVQSTTMFGGMENAGNIFYDEERVDNGASIEALVAHEISHQWFGNSVTEKSYAHLWLSEGFATFFTNYYLEQKYGKDTLRKRLHADRNAVMDYAYRKPGPVVDTTHNYLSLLNANSYQKGGLFLQALREKLGDQMFFTIIRSYYSQFKYKNADTNNFRTVVETITRKNWRQFFNDWLYQPGLPKK